MDKIAIHEANIVVQAITIIRLECEELSSELLRQSKKRQLEFLKSKLKSALKNLKTNLIAGE